MTMMVQYAHLVNAGFVLTKEERRTFRECASWLESYVAQNGLNPILLVEIRRAAKVIG